MWFDSIEQDIEGQDDERRKEDGLMVTMVMVTGFMVTDLEVRSEHF